MPNLRPFPSKETDLNLYFQTAVPYLNNNVSRLLVSSVNQELINTQLNEWNTIFPASQNANTRTKSIIENKDIAKNKLIASLRIIYADIPQSGLTTEDRNTLNLLAKDTSRTPTSVPTTVPIGQVNTNRRLEHTISFTNEDGSLAKPAGVRGCQISFKIGDAPTDPSELSFMATDTASPYVHQYNGADAGKNVYYWLRWENTRGEAGPWSDVVMATITA